MDKAVFINLDNTLITTKSGRPFPIHSEDWKVDTDVLEAIRKYGHNGYTIIILSNQIQIEHGFLTERRFKEKINTICKKIEKELKLKKPINFEYCYKEGSYKFMPNPGMVYECASEYELDLRQSIMIGNSYEHEQTAYNAGLYTYINSSEICNV